MNARDKAKNVADNLRNKKEVKEEKAMNEVKEELVVLHGNKVAPELIDFFKINAEVGSANLSGSLPQLKVTEKLSSNQLENGEMAEAGTFYYAPSQESFEELERPHQ